MEELIKIVRKIVNRNFILYGLIGTTAAAIDFFLFSTFYGSWGWEETFATSISTTTGILFSFTLNSTLNFKKTDKIPKRFLQFLSIGLLGLVISAIIVNIGIDIFGDEPGKISKIVAILISAVIQYILNSNVTFSE